VALVGIFEEQLGTIWPVENAEEILKKVDFTLSTFPG
jgi:hypothetical protein